MSVYKSISTKFRQIPWPIDTIHLATHPSIRHPPPVARIAPAELRIRANVGHAKEVTTLILL